MNPLYDFGRGACEAVSMPPPVWAILPASAHSFSHKPLLSRVSMCPCPCASASAHVRGASHAWALLALDMSRDVCLVAPVLSASPHSPAKRTPTYQHRAALHSNSSVHRVPMCVVRAYRHTHARTRVRRVALACTRVHMHIPARRCMAATWLLEPRGLVGSCAVLYASSWFATLF